MPHWQQQCGRAARIFGLAFLAQAAALDWTHLTRTALIAVAVAALEVTFRQLFPVNAVQ